MSEQLSLFEKAMLSDNLAKKKKSVKRKWENSFQKWSDNHGIESKILKIGVVADTAQCVIGARIIHTADRVSER